MAGITSSGSLMGARVTKKIAIDEVFTQFGSHLQCQARLAHASRTSQRHQAHILAQERCWTASTSFSRPMNGVGWMGRLLGELSSVLSGGKSVGKPSMTS